MQPNCNEKNTVQNSQNNIVSLFYVSVHHFPNHKLAQFLHKICFKMTYKTGTINLQSLFSAVSFVCRSVSSFCLLCLAASLLSLFCCIFVFALSYFFYALTVLQ